MSYKITQQEFETYLHAIVGKMTSGQILSYGDVYNILAEQLNNEVMEAWRKDNPLPSLSSQLESCRPDWLNLVKLVKADIHPDCRATDDPDDDKPGICLTVGFTPETEDKDFSWGYQTGDNSFMGGAYSHPHWAVVYIYEDSDCSEVADDIESQIAELAS